MNFDHHALEPLVALLLFSLPLCERRMRLSPAAMVAAVLCLLLTILFWRGSTMYWGLAFVSALGRALVGNNRPLARDYALVFGTAALILAAYCLLDPWGGARQIAFGVISWFHVIVLTAAALVLLLFGLCPSRRSFWWWLGGVGVVLLGAVLAGPLVGMVRQFVGGLSFVRGQGDPWLDSNSELRGVFKARYSFWYSASYLTPFWFLAPVALGFLARQWHKEGRIDPLLLNFLVWSPLLAMGFIIRYSHISALYTSLAAGLLATTIPVGGSAGRGTKGGLAVGILLLMLPGIPHYQAALTADLPGYMRYGLHGEQGVLAWLKERTPPTSYWENPVTKPEYGVLARWSMGALIYQVAGRPALSTAFGWEGYGFYQEAGFWVTEDEAKALRVAREAQVRYVVVQAVHDLNTDFAVASQGQARGELPPGLVGQELHAERSMHTRLMQGDGSMMRAADAMLPAMESLRLVHESSYLAKTEGAEMSYYKVFERVEGAVITGKAARGEAVILKLDLLTSRQRPFTYLTRVYAGEDGRFMARVPYATQSQQGDTRPVGEYTLYVGQAVKGTVSVTERDVVSGGRVEF
jgi:dolichyl-diphosphooligosaccharide--protein glycosyltransferase